MSTLGAAGVDMHKHVSRTQPMGVEVSLKSRSKLLGQPVFGLAVLNGWKQAEDCM